MLSVSATMTGRWQLALRRRRVPPVGLRATPSHAMALPSRRQSFGMGCASGMAGLRLGCPAPACVRSPSPSHTLCHAHSAGFPQSATMRSVTSWLARLSVWHTMCRSSPTSSQSPVSDSTCDPPRSRIKLAWTWLPAGFGEVDLSALFLMYKGVQPICAIKSYLFSSRLLPPS